MDLLLMLTYAAICIAIFKIFKIPLNKWTVPTAILGGVVIIGLILITMNYNHPYSEFSRQYFVITPIIPNVNGQVISVPAKPNIPLKAGDLLFQLDPEPFKNELLIAVSKLKVAQRDVERAVMLAKEKSISERDLEMTQARFDQLKAEVENAKYNLAQTSVKAPADGYVTQVSVRPGMRAVSLPLQPLMIFVPKESYYFTAWFRQNSLLRLKRGDLAEITFDSIPGKVFSGKVKLVLNVIAEGQVSPSSELISLSLTEHPGRIPVIIEITDPDFKDYENSLPGGAFARAAIYSEHFKHFAIIRKVLLRMSAWLSYIYPFH